jgi:hypothetical protein
VPQYSRAGWCVTSWGLPPSKQSRHQKYQPLICNKPWQNVHNIRASAEEEEINRTSCVNSARHQILCQLCKTWQLQLDNLTITTVKSDIFTQNIGQYPKCDQRSEQIQTNLPSLYRIYWVAFVHYAAATNTTPWFSDNMSCWRAFHTTSDHRWRQLHYVGLYNHHRPGKKEIIWELKQLKENMIWMIQAWLEYAAPDDGIHVAKLVSEGRGALLKMPRRSTNMKTMLILTLSALCPSILGHRIDDFQKIPRQ